MGHENKEDGIDHEGQLYGAFSPPSINSLKVEHVKHKATISTVKNAKQRVLTGAHNSSQDFMTLSWAGLFGSRESPMNTTSRFHNRAKRISVDSN